MDKICFKIDGPYLFTDGDNHDCPWGCAALADTSWPRANVCIFNADLIRSGTSFMMIFRVTLRRRKVRPFMMSPGLLVFSWIDRELLHCRTHSCGVEGSPGA